MNVGHAWLGLSIQTEPTWLYHGMTRTLHADGPLCKPSIIAAGAAGRDSSIAFRSGRMPTVRRFAEGCGFKAVCFFIESLSDKKKNGEECRKGLTATGSSAVDWINS